MGIENIDEAVSRVRDALESNESSNGPEYLAEKAKMFSSERFQEKIRELVNEAESTGEIPTCRRHKFGQSTVDEDFNA